LVFQVTFDNDWAEASYLDKLKLMFLGDESRALVENSEVSESEIGLTMQVVLDHDMTCAFILACNLTLSFCTLASLDHVHGTSSWHAPFLTVDMHRCMYT